MVSEVYVIIKVRNLQEINPVVQTIHINLLYAILLPLVSINVHLWDLHFAEKFIPALLRHE